MSVAGIQQGALAWYDAGCSIWPPAQDGTKRPMGEWKKWMVARVSRQSVAKMYEDTNLNGVGIICGKISGNLEMLELEGRATTSLALDAIRWEAQARGIEWLIDSFFEHGYAEWTPSGGIHFLYRLVDHEAPGNTKIARRPASEEELAANPADRIKTLSETRGEGGYVIVAPSGGTVHPSGDTWSTFAGKIGNIPVVKWNDRCLLVEAIKAALDEMPEVPEFTRPPAPRLAPTGTDRPGDDFTARASWEEILEPHGWRVHKRTNMETFWTRPGKDPRLGHSATTGFAGLGLDDRLYVWSSSTVFDTEKPYSKFGAYTLLEHNGDFAAAARALAARGYGKQHPVVVAPAPVPSAPVAPVLEPVATPPVAPAPVLPAPPVMSPATGIPDYKAEQLRHMSWDGIGVAKQWVSLHSKTFAYIPADRQWMMWNGDRWAIDSRLRHEHAAVTMVERMVTVAKQVETEDPELGKILVKEARKLTYNPQIQSIIRNARSDPRIAAAQEDFDKDPNLITLNNGVLNLETMQLVAHDPSMMLTRKMNASFDPSAPAGRWYRFMREVLPDPAVRSYLQRVCGYMLTGQMNERAMILLYGESGTGKTQFLEALREVMGDFAGIAPASAFQPRQHGYKGPSEDLHKLRGKRMVLQSELDAGSRFNEALVKSIVGADTQSTRPLYGAPVDWQPEYTVFLATNHLPRISSSENAIWNRVKPIQFAQVFINEQGQALDPSERGLGRRMAKQDADSILNWLLEGLAAYREMGLEEPEQVTEWLRGYREDVDTCRQFLVQGPDDGQLVVEEGAQGTVREVYNTYVAWCQDNGIMPLGLRNFNVRLESAGYVKSKKQQGIAWQGLGIPKGNMIISSQRPAGRWPRE